MKRQQGLRPNVRVYNRLLSSSAKTLWHRSLGTVSDDLLDAMQADEVPCKLEGSA